MMLIADCGSTKTAWALLPSPQGEPVCFTTGGMNVVMASADEVRLRISEAIDRIEGEVSAVRFYGAGCIAPEECSKVSRVFLDRWPCADVRVMTDLIGALHALCGDAEGIACILGTGSNSCYRDPEGNIANVRPLGFILGDEGSGAVLGRRVLGDVLKNRLPADLCDAFARFCPLDYPTLIRRVYRDSAPNRFLASLAPFLSANIERHEVEDLVIGEFIRFFERNVSQYSPWRTLPIGFVGSIAHAFAPQLRKAASRCGCSVGRILPAPLPALVAYHRQLFRTGRL